MTLKKLFSGGGEVNKPRFQQGGIGGGGLYAPLTESESIAAIIEDAITQPDDLLADKMPKRADQPNCNFNTNEVTIPIEHMKHFSVTAEFEEKMDLLYDEIKNTLAKKGSDYADIEDRYKNFRISEVALGIPVERAMLSRMLDKVSRINNLLDKAPQVVEESLSDSIMDLIGYSFLLAVYHHDTRHL